MSPIVITPSQIACVRRAAALPLYAAALLLDVASAALGRLAAWIAGDEWP